MNYYNAPRRRIKDDRNFWLYLLLTYVTCGIYGIIWYTEAADDLNTIAFRDGKKTMNYCLMAFVLAPLTCGIWGIVWCHQFSARIGHELTARGLRYSFGASDFWLWCVLGMFIGIGPFIYMYRLVKAMNYLAADYNYRG